MLGSIPARGQAVVDPTTAEFIPSADHNVVNNGVPVVDAYELGFYLLGASQPFQSVALGKPAPAGNGRIRVVFAGLMGAVPTPGINYEARVSALGPGGAGASAPSNVFSFSTPVTCTFGASPATQSIAASGGTANVSVSTASSCAWNATSNAGWISITAGSSGTGSGTVSYSVATNTGSARSGTLTMAGRTVTVNQSGAAACTFTASPATQNMAAGGGTGNVSVATTAGCGWNATSNAAWITVTAGSSGTGNGTVRYSVAANTGAARSSTLNISGQTVSVSQPAGVNAPSAPTDLRFMTPGG